MYSGIKLFMLPHMRAKQFIPKYCEFTSKDIVLFAVLKTKTIAHLIYDSNKSLIKEIFVEPEFRKMNIGKVLVSNILLFNPNLEAIDCDFFYKIGFHKLNDKVIPDVQKLDLVESRYIIKYHNLWYNSYTGVIINIKRNEIAIYKDELFNKGFLIPIQSDYEVIFEYNLKKTQIELPNSATIVLTDACNLSCSYCFEKNKSKQIIDDNQSLIRIWEKISSRIQNNFRLNFFGGEPLLNPNAIYFFVNQLRVYSKVNNLKYNLGMITNGTLITDSFVSFFKSDEFEHIQITLDGPKLVHDKIRGFFDKILFNSKKLLKITKWLGIRINITIYNYDSIKELLQYLDKFYSLDEKKKINLSFGFVYDPQIKLHVSKKQYNTLLKYIIQNDFFGFYFFKQPKNRIFICSASINLPSWFALDNSEYICEHLVGNTTSLVIDHTIYFAKECLNCKYYPICGGPCWMASKNKEPKYPKCIFISESVKNYVNKYKENV